MILFLTIFIYSCKSGKNIYTDIDEFTFVYGKGTYSISAWSDEIIKIVFSDSTSSDTRSYAPIEDRKIEMRVFETDSIILLKTLKTSVVIDLRNFKISFLDAAGRIKTELLEEVKFVGSTPVYHFSLQKNEAIYGTGSRALPLNRIGHAFLSYNMPRYAYGWGEQTLNFNIPHLLSSENYMILFDNPAKAHFDIGKTKENLLTYIPEGGNQTFYIISADNHKDLLFHYTEITGRQPLPPIWALGNLQSRFGYRSQTEAEEILEKSLAAGYSTDAIILDLYWFGPELEDGKMGELDWDRNKWPDPEGMISRFREKGIKTILVTEPFFTKKSKNFDYLSENNLLAKDSLGNTFIIDYFYFGPAGLLDIFKPEAKAWMWMQYRRLKELGIDGWWVDLGEPEQHPSGIRHINGSADEVHGLFGHEWAKMLSEGFEKDFPEERLFHMARAGFAGSQRYGMIPWSGDVGRNWSGLRAQPSIMLSMGLSGLAYMHSDAGGFTIDEQDEELYTRWLQFASFTPLFRPHADEIIPAEPVLWPDSTQKKVKPFIDLRYRMLPYIYTLAWENSITGAPIARPMFYEFEGISDTLFNQYMWGNNILVAPVLDKGLEKLKIYLPEGTWYDFYTEQAYGGEKWIEIKLEKDKIPIFIKGGAILPMAQQFSSTENYNTDTLEYIYFYCEKSSVNQFYFDDGKKNDTYANGEFQLILMNTSANKGALDLRIKTKGKSDSKYFGNKTARLRMVGNIKELHKIELNGIPVNTEVKENWIQFTIDN